MSVYKKTKGRIFNESLLSNVNSFPLGLRDFLKTLNLFNKYIIKTLLKLCIFNL